MLFIGSTGDQAGHTLFTWAIVNRLLEKGLHPGFFKPFGTSLEAGGFGADHDAMLFREALKLDAPLESICPYHIDNPIWRSKEPSQILEECRDLSRELSREKDVLIVMGSKHIFFDDAFLPVPDIHLATALGADFILVNRFRNTSASVYSVLFAFSLLKHLMKGVVVNRVPPDEMDNVRERLLQTLANKGIEIAPAIAEDPLLSLWSLREIADELCAEVLWGEQYLDRKVWRMTIGPYPLRGRAHLFKMVYNKIVFIASPSSRGEGDSNAFSSESIAGILLTGGVRPSFLLIEVAKGEKLPLLLTKEDAVLAMQRLERSSANLTSANKSKADHFCELLDREEKSLDRFLRCVTER